MSLSQGMQGSTIIATADACVEWATPISQAWYLRSSQVRYRESSTPDGWWQRTFVLDPTHWLCLSGRPYTTPTDAFRTILMQPDRPPIPLSLLVITMFLAATPHPDRVEQQQALAWVISAFPQVLHRLAVVSPVAGWEDLSRPLLDDLSPLVIDALLDPSSLMRWNFHDGVWADVFADVADTLWQFPSNAVRQIVTDAVARHESQRMNRYAPSDGWTVLGALSAMRFWHEPWPTIRGLPVQTSLRDLLHLWQQALIMMHPAAPAITDAQIAWLCDGTVGGPYDGPFVRLRAASPDRVACGRSPGEWQEYITHLRNETAQGAYDSTGCWEVVVSSAWPILVAFGVRTIRVMAGRDGCWVRLIPAERSWGSVLWWCPRKHPPAYWPMAFGQPVTSTQILAFHATLWQVWRNLRVDGCPENRNADGNLPAMRRDRPRGSHQSDT